MEREIEAVTRGVTAAWGADYRFEFQRGYPVLVNEPAMTAVAQAAAARVLEPSALQRAGLPIMAGEDFARYLEHVPGCFASLGVGTLGTTDRPSSHSGAFYLDESALPTGVAWYLSLVMNFDELRNGS
jgi:amidohydrolase